MNWPLLAWIVGVLLSTVIGLWATRRWLDKQDRTGGPP